MDAETSSKIECATGNSSRVSIPATDYPQCFPEATAFGSPNGGVDQLVSLFALQPQRTLMGFSSAQCNRNTWAPSSVKANPLTLLAEIVVACDVNPGASTILRQNRVKEFAANEQASTLLWPDCLEVGVTGGRQRGRRRAGSRAVEASSDPRVRILSPVCFLADNEVL